MKFLYANFVFFLIGRVLPAPALVYGPQERSTVTPRDGTWNMRGLQFVDARAIGKFGVLNLTRVNQQQIQAFMQALSKASTEMGTRFHAYFKVICLINFL